MRDDIHGKILKQKDAKLYFSGHSWKMKLGYYLKFTGTIRILTYSLPNKNDYCFQILGDIERKAFLSIICNSKFYEKAKYINENFPNVEVRIHDKLHSKAVIIEPETLHIGSMNFGSSGWHESSICIKSKMAVDSYITEEFCKIHNQSYLPLQIHPNG